MPAPSAYDYAILRVVPRVEREEFVNVGVLLYCHDRGFLRAAVQVDPARLAAFAPDLDVDLVQRHLEAVARICEGAREAGPIARLPVAERFRWLVSPRSTILQTGPVHGGVCEDPEAVLQQLVQRMVAPPTARQ